MDNSPLAEAYCSLNDVQSLFTRFRFSAETTPTAETIEEFIRLVASEINTKISRFYELPIEVTDATAKARKYLRLVNMVGAIAMVQESIGVAPGPEGAPKRTSNYTAQYKAQLRTLNRPSALVGMPVAARRQAQPIAPSSLYYPAPDCGVW